MNLIVYHIYCVGDYLEIAQKQLKRLVDSGLYDWCDTFEITCIDPENKFHGINDLFVNLPKANVFKTNANHYEYWAIRKIWDLAQENEGKVFYFHTKGVSNKYRNIITKEPSEWKTRGVNFWKESMEFFLVDNYKDCISKLNSHDHCGVTCNNGWYWGNFWWANLSFIKDNQEPGHGDRWYYENWLNNQRKYNSFEFFHFDYNGYFSHFPESIYKNGKTLWDVDCILESAFYGTLDIQQDEGCDIPTKEILVDVTKELKDLIKRGITVSNVDNIYFGDPAYMQKKYLIINFTIQGDKAVVVYNEGWKFDINFLKF